MVYLRVFLLHLHHLQTQFVLHVMKLIALTMIAIHYTQMIQSNFSSYLPLSASSSNTIFPWRTSIMLTNYFVNMVLG